MHADDEVGPPPTGALGDVRIRIASRLGDDWRPLAIYLEIPDREQRRFPPGDEAHKIWDWLANRDELGRLAPALTAIERPDLAILLPGERDLSRSVARPARLAIRRLTPRRWAVIATVAVVVMAGPPAAFVMYRTTGTSTTTPSTSASPLSPDPVAAPSGPVVTPSAEPGLAGSVVFADDFSSKGSGWDSHLSNRSDGHGTYYKSGALLFWNDLTHQGPWAMPAKVTAVYPYAPKNVGVEARVRWEKRNSGDWLGLSCRSEESRSYLFLITEGIAQIVKMQPQHKVLGDSVTLAADPAQSHLLRAECISPEGKNEVHLILSVDGERILERTDDSDAIPSGSVGVVLTTGPSGRLAEAQFYDFTVTRL
jgi:hypothetical protein